MPLIAVVLAALLQAAPPPSPPPLTGPLPSPSPAATAPPGQLIAEPSALNLHPGAVQIVVVRNASGAVRASLDQAMGSVSVDPATNEITLTAGATPARGTLIISDASGASTQISLRIALDAGSVPAGLSLRVTGSPIDPSWLRSAIAKAVTQQSRLQPGVTPQIGDFGVPSLSANRSVAVSVSVHLPGGDQYFDVDTVANVSLTQVPVAPFAPLWLLYDDDPERLNAEGITYRNTVTAGAPATLYYYHQNGQDPRRLLVVLRPSSSNGATVQLIDSSAGPNQDVMSVGHAVSREFLLAKRANQGLVVDLPPAQPYVADQFALNPLDGAAGSIGINVLAGGPVEVSVVSAVASGTDPDIGSLLSQPRLPGDGHNRTGVFRIDRYAQDTIPYTVGGDDASLLYGATTPPPASDAVAGHDYGDYGIVRSVVFHASNPTNQPATIYLYEQPQGGVVRSSFLVNGSLVQLGCARLPNRYQIGQPFELSGGQSSTIELETMTDGGSNYPLEVGLTQTAPTPDTPSMFAPDGCFPKPQTSL